MDPDVIGHTLAADPGVFEVHDLHVWEVTSGFTAPSYPATSLASESAMRCVDPEHFDIDHVTLQVDHFQTEYRVPMQEIRHTKWPLPETG